MNKKYSILKHYLYKEYIIKKRTALDLAHEINCDRTTIVRALKKYNIPIRNIKETAILLRNRMLGDNNPMKRPEIARKLSRKLKGRKMTLSWRRKISEAIKKWLFNPKHHWAYGKKNPEQSKRMKGNKLGYKHGNGYSPYPPQFNNELKESIRKRDNYQCQVCHKYGIHVHHIDYNKQNCNENNLIITCMKCNVKANWNIDYWYSYFMYIMINFIDKIQ